MTAPFSTPPTSASNLARRDILIGGAASLLLGGSGCANADGQARAAKPTPRASGWSLAPSLPEAAQEIYPCGHAGSLHLAGGFTAVDGRINGPTAAHNSWRPGDAAWTAGTPLPSARHHPHLISFENRLLAFAGFEGPAGQPLSAAGMWTIQNTGWMLPRGGEAWEAMPDLPAPAAEAVVGITGDGALHLAGGRTWAKDGQTGAWNDHSDTDHHFVLSGLNSKWERAAPCPHKRNSTAGGVINGALHIIGGRQVGGGNLDHHTVYDYKTDKWRDLAPLPQAQGGLAAASIGGKLYGFGGEFFDNGGGVYPQGWVYDPARDMWTALPDMPNPRHGLGAVTLGDSIYVIGGALQASGVDTSAFVEVFTP